jgi:hypothetical protein
MTAGEKEPVRFNSFKMSQASATKVTDFVKSTLGKSVPSVSATRVRFSSQTLLLCITGSCSPREAINILGCTDRPFAGVLPTLRITKFKLTCAAPSGVKVSGLSMDVSIEIHGLCDSSSCRAVASAVLFAALEDCSLARRSSPQLRQIEDQQDNSDRDGSGLEQRLPPRCGYALRLFGRSTIHCRRIRDHQGRRWQSTLLFVVCAFSTLGLPSAISL